ncbi:hypothetical protein ACQP60_18845 [Isoptericola variabilis]|uniref:hypothetical protein n=1 Tax=Isoptericola variabilis TaxID=139208 RepID=UPI003D20D3C4
MGLAPLALPTGRPDVDLDAVRERREAERARRAATNPFAEPSGQRRSMSAPRALAGALVSTEYEAAAFPTPRPASGRARTSNVRPRQRAARRIDTDRTQQIVALYTSPDEPTMAQIGQRLGCSRKVVAAALAKAGVKTRQRGTPRDDARARRAVELYTSPEQPTLRDIADRLGCSHQTVAVDLRRAGIVLRSRGYRSKNAQEDA